MLLTTVRRRMARLEAQAGKSCPLCVDWPAEIGIKLVEIVIEPGEPLPAPDRFDPCQFGPCPGCGQRHRARVIAFEE
jgi:hypothetical protein